MSANIHMHRDGFSYNPDYFYKDSLTWFRNFILLQDETPSNILRIKDDTVFLTNRIIQVKAEKPKFIEKSIFSTHLLHPGSAIPKERQVINPGWISVLIVLCFFLFAIAQYSYFKRMQQIVKAFFSNRLFNQLSRDSGLFRERISLFLFSSFLLCLSLFIFNTYGFYFGIPSSGLMSFWLFIKILAGVSLFYLFKMWLFNFSGFIFKTKKEASNYVLNIYVFGQIAGVVLLPVIVLMSYLHSETIIYAGGILLVLLYVYSLFRGVVCVTYGVKISVYYLFLYLCTLEILPLFILAKIFNVLGS